LWQNLKEEVEQFERIESCQRYIAICKSSNSKPLWQAFSESQTHAHAASLFEQIPHSFKQALSFNLPKAYTGENISCIFKPDPDSTFPSFTTKDERTGEMV